MVGGLILASRVGVVFFVFRADVASGQGRALM